MAFVSLRELLSQKLEDFLDDFGRPNEIVNLRMGIVAVIEKLKLFREEGKALSPDLLVYHSEDAVTIKGIITVGEVVKIGSAPLEPTSFSLALKKCGLLANGPWKIFIEIADQQIHFGVCRLAPSPIASPPEDVLLNCDEAEYPDLCFLSIHQITENAVELRAVRKRRLEVHYSVLREGEANVLSPLKRLTDKITRDLAEPLTSQVRAFLSPIISQACREGHGILVAVLPYGSEYPLFFSDGVVLEEPISVSAKVSEWSSAQDLAGYSGLESTSRLLKGMLTTDGITVFDTKGNLVAYNVFYNGANAGGTLGGARKRTFDGLSLRVTEGVLVSAFMQSQDGASFENSRNV